MADSDKDLIAQEWRQVSSLLNFAHPTGFVIDFPIKDIGLGKTLKQIGYNEKHFAMNITNFTLNRLELKPNEVFKTAYQLHYPSWTEQGTKQFTINYKLSSQYQQYAFLSGWWQQNLKVISHIKDEEIDERVYNNPEYLLVDVRLWCLDEHKDPVMVVRYEDAWLNELGEMQLSYSDTNNTLSHSFSCYYNDYKITILNPILNNV